MHTMRKIILPLALLFAFVLVQAGCQTTTDTTNSSTSSETSSEQTASSVDDANTTSTEAATSSAAEDGIFGTFQTTDLAGASVTQEIFTHSDLTMVNIWATYCDPCLQEMPHLAELSDEYQGKMQIVGIITDVTQPNDETASEIVAQTGADYTNLVLSKDMYSGYLSKVQVVPTTVFVDRDGKQVGEVYTGARDKAAWKNIIDEMLTQVDEG